jgi:hypothetical protein
MSQATRIGRASATAIRSGLDIDALPCLEGRRSPTFCIIWPSPPRGAHGKAEEDAAQTLVGQMQRKS